MGISVEIQTDSDMAEHADGLLEISGLSIDIAGSNVVHDVSLALERGHIVGLVGPSGAGKSTVLSAVSGMLPANSIVKSGKVLLSGKESGDFDIDLLKVSDELRRKLRGRRLGMIFQNPGSYLDPTMRVGAQLVEVLRCHTDVSAREAHALALSLFERVALPNPKSLLRAYPYELSGGMQQRVSIALAMALGPEILLADEPTSALDPTTQVTITEELRRLRDAQGTSILLVTHDIGLAYRLCDELYVMDSGRVVESGKASSVVENPASSMTKALVDAVPRILEGKL